MQSFPLGETDKKQTKTQHNVKEKDGDKGTGEGTESWGGPVFDRVVKDGWSFTKLIVSKIFDHKPLQFLSPPPHYMKIYLIIFYT